MTRSQMTQVCLGALCVVMLAGCASKGGGYGAPSAAALMRAQQDDEAKAKTAAPDTKELYLSMIREMQERGAYFASLAHIDQFRIQYGNSPDVDILRADALRETGQPDAAEATYRTLLASPVAAAAWHGLGLVAAQRKDYAGATQALREAVSRAPTEPFYLSDLGFAQLCNGDAAGARVPLAQAAELKPDSRKVLSNLAVYLLVTGERARADQMMTQAKMPPATREAIDKLATDIRTHTQAARAAADAAAARAAAQAAAAIVPPVPPVAAVATVATVAVTAASAQPTPPVAAPSAKASNVVVRLPEPGARAVAATVDAAPNRTAANAADAKLARASDVARSDMPTSMLDRFANSSNSQ
ncbi:Beta-barrel assembly-enhancing protease [Pandoraea iniqua]|uniref:tetratricopeptide repeat protein n=1 Tax=Pandoraea iniqua TaxID=2508288 RepID=UPI00123FE55F|nr:tetratricopeptide repeat protein [Pandoraea iniqua]VVE19583.1 Beta-barrel assembly-enhancing protease [Pandoraea iniqua]